MPSTAKILRRKTVCHVHDEKNESHIGDTVEITECPPASKLKRWELIRVVSKSKIVDIAAMACPRQKASEAEGLEVSRKACDLNHDRRPPTAISLQSETSDQKEIA